MGKIHTIKESKEIIEGILEPRKKIERTLNLAEKALESARKSNIAGKMVEIEGVAVTLEEHLSRLIESSKIHLTIADNAIEEEKFSIALVSRDIDEIIESPIFKKMLTKS